MNTIYQKFRCQIDDKNLTERVKTLCRIERGQTFKHYHLATEHILSELKKYNIPNAEILQYPADGTTVFEDKCMPIAWDASVGKLTLCDDQSTVAADYTQEPFNLIKGSTATADGGEIVRIVTEQQMLAGEDVHGALIMLDTSTPPRAQALTTALDLGARGIISDYLFGRYEDADAVQWVNACTEGPHWHIQSTDRDFIGFSISLRMASKIRALAARGILKAKVECDGKRYCGKLPAVTALIPGKRKEEVWLLAHTFEPLLNDDANGIIAAVETARMIMREGTPEYSLRLIFAMELYGFAAFHANFNGKVIGACNIDSLPSSGGDFCRMTPPISSVPFHGIDIFKEIARGFPGAPAMELTPPRGFDDMFLSDSTTAVPTAWMLFGNNEKPYLWHNSLQTKDDFIDPELFADYTALVALWVYKTIFSAVPAAEFEPLKTVRQDTPMRRYAAKHIYSRSLPCQPFDLCRVPQEEKFQLPEGMLYGAFEIVLSRLDGKKDLATVIMEAEAEYQTSISDEMIRKYINALNNLADYGYIKAVKRTENSAAMLTEALRKLGVVPGDTLLVHASQSKCGYFTGGASGLIDGIFNAVTGEGAALFTAFTRPYIYLGGVNKAWNYRPYDPQDLTQICTGNAAKVMLQKYPDAIRSKHITHSWAGIGKKAAGCLKSHGKTDAPASADSPLGKALQAGGKVLFAGSGLGPTTFLHYLETELNLPYLERALCKVRVNAAQDAVVSIDQHLPGHRDFYRPDAENSKFYQRAIARGLQIKSCDFNIGKLHLIELKQLHDIGLQILQEDPNVLLCDDPECIFCRKHKC